MLPVMNRRYAITKRGRALDGYVRLHPAVELGEMGPVLALKPALEVAEGKGAVYGPYWRYVASLKRGPIRELERRR